MTSLRTAPAPHDSFVNDILCSAREDVQGFVGKAAYYDDPRRTIGLYTAAVAINFTDWIGKTLPWVRHERARYALTENLRLEQSDDHVGMLLRFAEDANAMPSEEMFARVAQPVAGIRIFLKDVRNAGFVGLTILAILEGTSPIFIPVLEELGRELGVKDLTYTRVHGEADAAHAEDLANALKAELDMGYNTGFLLDNARDATVRLLRVIFEH